MTDEQLDEWAVMRLATNVRERLKDARENGRSGWFTVSCTNESLSEALHSNVKSGDPVDVAAYCAFLLARSSNILPTKEIALKLALDKWSEDMVKFMASVNQLNSTMSQSHGNAIRVLVD